MTGLKIFYTQGRRGALYFILFPLLFVLSCIYFLLVSFVYFLYKSRILRTYHSKCKVISVGNITLGGSGKTPVVEYLARRLATLGHNPAILLKGYKTPNKNRGLGLPDYYVYGDEASMLKESLGETALVLTGPNRASLAAQIDANRIADTILLDDGFQHWCLARQWDIVVIDVLRSFGTRLILPAGHLREGLSSLRRADCFILSHCDEVSSQELVDLEAVLSSVNPGADILHSVHEPESLYRLIDGRRFDPDILKDAPVGLLCGIANPASFVNTVKKLGAQVVFEKFFDDHHDYSEDDLAGFIESCHACGIERVLTTAKDAQRIGAWVRSHEARIDILVLRIVLKMIRGEEILDGRLHSLYRS